MTLKLKKWGNSKKMNIANGLYICYNVSKQKRQDIVSVQTANKKP